MRRTPKAKDTRKLNRQLPTSRSSGTITFSFQSRGQAGGAFFIRAGAAQDTVGGSVGDAIGPGVGERMMEGFDSKWKRKITDAFE